VGKYAHPSPSLSFVIPGSEPKNPYTATNVPGAPFKPSFGLSGQVRRKSGEAEGSAVRFSLTIRDGSVTLTLGVGNNRWDPSSRFETWDPCNRFQMEALLPLSCHEERLRLFDSPKGPLIMSQFGLAQQSRMQPVG
jgi:hypothetical protein